MRIPSFFTAIGATALLLIGNAVQAQTYPNKSVRIVVPYATGGGSDILARQIGAGLQTLWGQGVVVDNKAGASGNIGTSEVVRAPADGYTLLLQNSTMVTNLGVMGKLPYDPEKDLTPIMLLGVTPIALAAHPSANIGNVKDLVAAAKAKPDALSYGSCGIGTPQHFVMELVKQKTGVAAAHAGYKGCAPAVTDVVGGQIPMAIVSANLVAPYAKDGRLKVVGVSTGQRYSLLPDTPTFEEQGLKPFDFSIWYALMGPKDLPPAVVAKLAADVSKILSQPAVVSSLSNAGVELYKGTGDDLAKLIKADAKRYTDLAKSANIKAE
ncbi:tripartite tricarboxylate transporter substrate binding protein [Hydrogenophaga sp.]|uniref:Bug family tripartite tricarboxylate transporter substrate binding protein n=1 Tax=Hydrogenophaga sp. TaxID=1904254 RepID=UPI0027256FDC|nr:tripartite tricarboxylate transporter substrate binding protein [Hydrogenophaga sp.]MDO9435239.1 tripartite tricarboxylate transporter substrate binding protein [Hydrogenophaga sp.]